MSTRRRGTNPDAQRAQRDSPPLPAPAPSESPKSDVHSTERETERTSDGVGRVSTTSDVLPARRTKRTRTGRHLAVEADSSLDPFLRGAVALPIERGVEAVARAVCDVIREAIPGCAVAVELGGEGEGGQTLFVSPSVHEAAPSIDALPAPSRGVATDTDPGRLFPTFDEEWIVHLPAPFDLHSLHVAVNEKGAATAAKERVARGALLLACGLRAAAQVRTRMSESSQLRDLQSRIVQSEKLASIGQIAAKVVHELNNPLTAIVTYAEFLTRKLEHAQHEAADVERLRRIGQSADRILRFSRDLTTYARPNEEVSAELTVAELLERSIVFCEHVTGEHGISVVTRFEAETPSIVGRRGQLTQVFVNLITNACHAIQDADRTYEGEIVVTAEASPEGRVRISVGDNGLGISPENVVRVFDPFFTTKREGRGTGLGLSIVKSIVEEHGGRVWVRTMVGRGAQFIVELPAGR